MKISFINVIGKPMVVHYLPETPEEKQKLLNFKKKTNRAILNKKGRKYAITTR